MRGFTQAEPSKSKAQDELQACVKWRIGFVQCQFASRLTEVTASLLLAHSVQLGQKEFKILL